MAAALQPALAGLLPLEALREGAVQWLAAHSGWLVILDNVTDPADVAPLLARAPAGRYLITSRRATGWHATAVPVRLDVLDPAEAQALLAAILASDRPREADGPAELCEELGFLPLALEQAGAYLAQAGATPWEYLSLLARYPAAMYQAAPEGGDAARTIARIWRVTLDRLDQLTARADAGDRAAAYQLADLLAERGDLDQAGQILRTRADAGDWRVAQRLAILLVERGDLDQAGQILRTRADAGDQAAALQLADLLAERGNFSQAEQILRTRADVGDWRVAQRLAELLKRRGRREEAEWLRRFGLAPDGSTASG